MLSTVLYYELAMKVPIPVGITVYLLTCLFCFTSTKQEHNMSSIYTNGVRGRGGEDENDRQTDRQTGRQTDIRTNRQTKGNERYRRRTIAIVIIHFLFSDDGFECIVPVCLDGEESFVEFTDIPDLEVGKYNHLHNNNGKQHNIHSTVTKLYSVYFKKMVDTRAKSNLVSSPNVVSSFLVECRRMEKGGYRWFCVGLLGNRQGVVSEGYRPIAWHTKKGELHNGCYSSG